MNTQTYTVNIRTGVVNITRVDVSQGDTGRTLAFSLYDGLIPFTPPTGSTVTIVGSKPSGLGFSETCTVSGNTAAVNTTLAMTQESGKFPVELRIESDTRSIGTANFVMHVEPSPHPAGTTDGTTEEARTVLAQCESYAQIAQEAAEAASGDYTEIREDVDDLTDRVDAFESGGGGLTNDVKTALLACLRHVGFLDSDADYYQNLYDALYPIVSISAVYTQSDAVFDTDDLSVLTNDLVVTATYGDGTTEIIPSGAYTLSGSLDSTTSTITVTCGSITTTFNVSVVLISQMTESVMISGYDSRNASNTASAGPYCLKINDVYIYDYSAYITGIKLKVQTAGILHIDVIPSSVVENNRVTDEWASRVNKAVITTTSTGEQTVYFDRPFAIPNGYCLVIGRGTTYGDDTCIWKYGSYGTQKGFCWHSGSSDKSLGIDVITKGGAS